MIDKINERIAALEVGEVLRLEGVDDDIYHASDGFGSSKMKSFMKCPEFFIKESQPEFQKEKEPAHFAVGRAFHSSVLEPELFENDYIIQPADIKVRNGKKWTAFLDDAIERRKKILTQKKMNEVLYMRDSCKAKFSHYLKDGKSEVSYWRRYSSSLVFKARIDREVGDLAVDLKSTADVFKFENQARNFQYDIQAAHYLWVTENHLAEMVFLPTANSEPYLSGTPLLIDEQRMYDRKMRWDLAAKELDASLIFNHFKGLPDEPIYLDLKPWEISI